MRHRTKVLGDERGSSFIVSVWAAVILLILGVSGLYMADNQHEQAERDIKSLNAVNIAEAAIQQKIEDMAAVGAAGTTPWTSTSFLGTSTGTVHNGAATGDFSLSTTTDTHGSAYKLLTATGTYEGVSETVTVRVKGFPELFAYVLSASSKLEISADGEDVIAVGNFHTNGDLTLQTKAGGTIDLNQANGTYTGSLTKKPAGLDPGGTLSQASTINFPVMDISYYRDQANWPGQTVVNIDIDNPPSSLDPYKSGKVYTIPVSDIDGLFGAGSIVNFSCPSGSKATQVKVYNPNAAPVTLTQTFTGEDFGVLQFEGNINLLPVSGQAVIGQNLNALNLNGGVQVGAVGNGALVYSFGNQSACGRIYLDDNVSLYGSFVEYITVGGNLKCELKNGFIQFDDAFIEKLGTGQSDQFLNWGTFRLKKVHYEQ